MQKRERHGHQVIDILLMVGALCRVPWWLLQLYKYEPDSLPAVMTQILNRSAFALTYFAQSFYMRQWIVVILTLNRQSGKLVVTVSFLVLDTVVGLAMLVTIISRIFDKYDAEKYPGSGYGVIYDVGISIFGACALLISIMFLVLGGVIMRKLRQFYRCGSRTVLTFLGVSAAIFVANFLRFFCLFYRFFFKHRGPAGMFMANLEFQVLCYLVPDALIAIVLVLVHVDALLVERNKQSNLQKRGIVTTEMVGDIMPDYTDMI